MLDIDADKEKILYLNLYADEFGAEDTVGNSGYLAQVKEHFGKRCLRGTALIATCKENGRIKTEDMEPFLRHLFDQVRPKMAVEIGTLFGVTTALLAHYSERVLTIDIAYQQTAAYIKHFFGVDEKITNAILEDDAEKAEVLGAIDFDFAFIDAIHTYDGVKGDFGLVKKCGRVLLHDYKIDMFPGVTKFIDELPEDEVIKRPPFAFWEKR